MRRIRCMDQVSVGDRIGPLRKGPLTTAHIMRWSAAIENWHKIHYDRTFAQRHDGLPDLLVNGSLKQQFVMQLLREWASPGGWVWKATFQFRAMTLVGDTPTVWATVRAKRYLPDYGLVDIDLGVLNEDGKETTPGSAVIALPHTPASPVPYPFVPPESHPSGGEAR